MMRLAIALLVATSLLGGASAQEPHRPRVLIDRSHAWLFAHDDLARTLTTAGFDVTFCEATLNTAAKLADFDVVFVLHFGVGHVRFLPAEFDLLKRYVTDGGSLFLVCGPTAAGHDLAAAFGFDSRDQRLATPLTTAPTLHALGAPATFPLASQLDAQCALAVPAGAELAVSAANGTPVAARVRLGRGQVLCYADAGNYWEFCSQRAAAPLPTVPVTVALFRSLLPPGLIVPAGQGQLNGFRAEVRLDTGDMRIKYGEPVALLARPVVAALPQLSALVARANGTFVDTKLDIDVLAGGWAGFSGGTEIGVPCDSGTTEGDIECIAHEMTHHYSGPLGVLSEAWASLNGLRVVRALGYTQAADRARLDWRKQFEAADPRGKALDIAHPGADQQGACEGKVMWMIEQLESRYGADFMARFVQMVRAVEGSHHPTTDQLLNYFSLTAGQELSPWYREIGVSYKPPQPVDPATLNTKLAAYRERKAAFDLDQAELRSYRAQPERFASDDWRSEWSVDAVLPQYRPGHNWIDDPRQPTEPWMTYLAADAVAADATGEHRGLLVVHAPAPDKPARLTRAMDLQATGHTYLHLGVVRRRSARQVVRLRVNGVVVWRRALEGDSWLHSRADLTRFAGQRISLALEFDTEGAWNGREAMVDYLTVLNETQEPQR